MNYTNPILRKTGSQLAQSIRPDQAEYNLKVGAWETNDQYEIFEMQWPDGFVIPNHYHHNGIESFFILNGTVKAVLNGKKFTLKPGDLVSTPKYLPHYFEFSKDTILLGLFFDVHYFSKESGGILYRKYLASQGFVPDEQFNAAKMIKGDSYPCLLELNEETADHHFLRRKGEGLATYQFGKRTSKLKVPIWETDGKGEIWEVFWEKGAGADMHYHNLSYESFYVTNGSVEVFDGEETFTARVGDCVHLRPYVTHSLKALEDHTTTLNVRVNINPGTLSLQQYFIDRVALEGQQDELAALRVANDIHRL